MVTDRWFAPYQYIVTRSRTKSCLQRDLSNVLPFTEKRNAVTFW